MIQNIFFSFNLQEERSSSVNFFLVRFSSKTSVFSLKQFQRWFFIPVVVYFFASFFWSFLFCSFLSKINVAKILFFSGKSFVFWIMWYKMGTIYGDEVLILLDKKNLEVILRPVQKSQARVAFVFFNKNSGN